MAKTKSMEDIRKMTTEDLMKSSQDLRNEISEMKRRIHMGEVTNPRVIRSKRRELARTLTVLGEQLSKEKA